MTVQDRLSNRAYALTDEDAGIFLALIDKVLEGYDLPSLTSEEAAELDELNAKIKAGDYSDFVEWDEKTQTWKEFIV